MRRPTMLLVRTFILLLSLASIAMATTPTTKTNRVIARLSLDDLSHHSESETQKMLDFCKQQKIKSLLNTWTELETYLANQISELNPSEKEKVADQETLYQTLEFLMPHLIPDEVPMGEVPARCLDSITDVKSALQNKSVSTKQYQQKVDALSGCWHEQYRLDFPAFAEQWIDCFKKLK